MIHSYLDQTEFNQVYPKSRRDLYFGFGGVLQKGQVCLVKRTEKKEFDVKSFPVIEERWYRVEEYPFDDLTKISVFAMKPHIREIFLKRLKQVRNHPVLNYRWP